MANVSTGSIEENLVDSIVTEIVEVEQLISLQVRLLFLI